MPPHTTTRRITTNLKTNNTQNCQKIELYESMTTNDLKKPHSSRLVGGVEMRNWNREVRRGSVVRQRLQNGLSHIFMWWIKIRRDTLGVSDPCSRPDYIAQGSSAGKIKLRNFWL